MNSFSPSDKSKDEDDVDIDIIPSETAYKDDLDEDDDDLDPNIIPIETAYMLEAKVKIMAHKYKRKMVSSVEYKV